ncbi:hypothetical protein [Phytopseudomonas seleniipraecipitans]|uniref:AtuA-like ferredoxin-fold domain-containing protein n=1 Tax=Phytopseudomonas seleniipraecipitans TaxID=640205 RepID=A0A1G7G4S0_9GAMM|nr:hypothetical protein [Pseudomonas seleniipraecipitans]SDE83009.1 hypothetical protein SAMN05216381_0013 [Pseudomonas seleniipraecipitans]
MTENVVLCDYAHARAGDKGNILSVAIFAYDPAHYAWLAAELTVERVASCLAHRQIGRVRRYELPNLGGFNFVVENALEGGVNASPGIDRHGKSLSYLLLDLRLPAPA